MVCKLGPKIVTQWSGQLHGSSLFHFQGMRVCAMSLYQYFFIIWINNFDDLMEEMIRCSRKKLFEVNLTLEIDVSLMASYLRTF